MISRSKKQPVTVGMFARSTERELEERIEALDLEIVTAAHDSQERHELLAERTRLVRKLETIKGLERGIKCD